MKKRLLMCLMALGMYQAQATDYYVNDGVLEPGSICSAVGAAGNSGLNPTVPKTLTSVVNGLSLQPGDIVYIDKGLYTSQWGCSGTLGAGTAANPIRFVGVDSSSTNIKGVLGVGNGMEISCTTPQNLYWEFSNLAITAEAGLTALIVGIGGRPYANVKYTNCMIKAEAGPAINVIGSMDNFTFTGCRIQSNVTCLNLVAGGGPTTITNNTFSNCTIVHAATSGQTVVYVGAGTRNNNTFDKCTIINNGNGNIFEFPGGNHEFTKITNCQIKGTNSPVAATFAGGSALTSFQFTNNYVSGVVTGIASANPNQGFMNISNNSFYTSGNCLGNSATGGYFRDATIRNNIFYSTATAGANNAALFINSNAGANINPPALIDYNHYYTPNGANAGNFNGTAKATLALWQNTIGTNDANSSTGDPLYASAAAGDLSISCSSPAFKTGFATTLTTDIFGSTRPATPSKGAYENTTVVTVTTNPTAPSYCVGGSASITASGATTYSWSPATALSATTGATVTANPTNTTTYTITGTSAGCTGTATVTVTVNNLPTIAVSPAAPAICEGATASLTASGATSYSWSPATDLDATTGATVNATPASDATYTVTGTDANSCTNTATVTVTVNANPATPVLADFDDVCSNASNVTLAGATPTGGVYSGTGVTSGEFDPSTGAGTYTITYTYTDGNGCSSEIDASITVNAAPSAPVLANFADVCSNASALTLAGATPTGGVYSGTGVTAGSFDPATAGSGTHTITYTITDANNCTASTDATILVTVCTGINDSKNGVATSIYPNPNEGTFQLTFDPNKSGNVEMVLLNAQGQEQYRRKLAISGSTEKVALDLTPGVYHLQLLYEGSTYHEKVVIR